MSPHPSEIAVNRRRARVRLPLRERFFANVSKRKTGCWLWTAARDRHGYGTIMERGRTRRAHRVSWEIHRGPLAPRDQVLHTCDTPHCVNPLHLFLGTPLSNAHDRDAKARGPRGRKNGRAKLTAAKVVTIRKTWARGRQGCALFEQLAEQHGVSVHTIAGVVYRQSWRWVGEGQAGARGAIEALGARRQNHTVGDA
jgi:hypothetical protein